MNRSIALLTIVAAALFVVFVSTPAVLAQPQSLLTHHVQPAVLNGQATFVGKLPANQTMRIDIVMAVRDQASLDRFLQDVYDPSSSSYHQFLTVDQFTAEVRTESA